MKTYKWTAEQKKALRGSIRKWQKIVKGTGTDEGIDNCPCCKQWFHSDDESYLCEGCPISEFVGDVECAGTPYRTYEMSDNSKYVAVTELNFLRAVYLAGGGK